MDVLRWHRLDGYKSGITLDKTKYLSMEASWQSLCDYQVVLQVD